MGLRVTLCLEDIMCVAKITRDKTRVRDSFQESRSCRTSGFLNIAMLANLN